VKQDDYIAELQAVILNLHGVVAEYVETIPVHEEYQGQTVWEGDVEVFELRDHPKAKRAYGWGYEDEETGRHYVTVLELPPVTSPDTAVKASIVRDYRDQQKRH
jgi:hypothetical protein